MSNAQNIFIEVLDHAIMDAISVLLSCNASNPYVSIGTAVVAKCRATKGFLRLASLLGSQLTLLTGGMCAYIAVLK